MEKKTIEREPCTLLSKKIRDHNAITMCPYCKHQFDIHTGMIFLEGKQVDPPPKKTHDFFYEVMK